MCTFANRQAPSLQMKQILPKIDAPDPPGPPPSKGKGLFKGSKKRTLSYVTRNCSNNQKAARCPPQDNSVNDYMSIELAAKQ